MPALGDRSRLVTAEVQAGRAGRRSRRSDDAAVDVAVEALPDALGRGGSDRVRVDVGAGEPGGRDQVGDVVRFAGWTDRDDRVAALRELGQ